MLPLSFIISCDDGCHNCAEGERESSCEVEICHKYEKLKNKDSLELTMRMERERRFQLPNWANLVQVGAVSWIDRPDCELSEIYEEDEDQASVKWVTRIHWSGVRAKRNLWGARNSGFRQPSSDVACPVEAATCRPSL